MKTQDALSYFKSQSAIAQALGINQASIAKWVKQEAIPHLRQLQLEALTGGALKADSTILPRRTAKYGRSNKSVKV